MDLTSLPTLSQFAPDEESKVEQFDFSGEWQPSSHEMRTPSGNYSNIQNIRQDRFGVSVINGYSKINTVTALSTHPYGRSGFQLRSPHTQKSYILVQQRNVALDQGRVYVHKGTPPNTGDFVVSTLHSDATGFGLGRFIEAPDNNVIYCNGVETKIYGGDEATIASFILATSISLLVLTNPVVYTNEMRNDLTTPGNVIAFVAASNIYLVGSPRPLSGITPYCSVYNASVATATVAEWTGSAWSNLVITDTTRKDGDKSHGQAGTITFPDTTTTSKPAFMNDQLLYWYKVSLSAGSFTLYHVTMTVPWQGLKDVWDGVNRVCIQCQVNRSGVNEDYTAEVYDASTIQYPIAAKFAGLLSSDSVVLMFDERMTAIRWSFLAGLVNTTAATITIKYWNGTAFATVGTVQDGTRDSGGTKSMNLSGTTSWNPPDVSLEHPVNMFDVYGYAYQLSWNATLTADDGSGTVGCYPDTIYGIPAVRDMGAYKFAFNFKNRVFLAGDIAGKAGHCLDFGAIDAADCFSGNDTSGIKRRMYVGANSSELVGAANVFNRFGASIYNSEILLKPTETYLLDGSDATVDPFKISKISDNIGLAAPLSLSTAEIAFEITRDAIRNIALWISNAGPMIFDAAVLMPLRGIDNYFDRKKTECVNYNALSCAHSWFDPTTYDWNVCIPSGAAATTCTVWLRYNLIEKKWFKNDVGSQYIPQAAFKVVDNYGNVYFYGLIDDGHMVRLENGNTWNDTETIEGSITTNAMLPTKNIFDTTTIRNLALLFEGDGAYDVTYTRSDISITGSGIETGYLRVYGKVIEDPDCTASYWDGDDFVCKTIKENQALVGVAWQDVAGVVSITNTIIEGFVTEINTVAGNFVTAGFLVGFLIETSDPNNEGPLLCSSVSATKMTFLLSRTAKSFSAGMSLTLSTLLVRVYYYNNGSNVPVLISNSTLTMVDKYTLLMFSIGETGLCHKFKFSFYSRSTTVPKKPLAWGYQYLLIRS